MGQSKAAGAGAAPARLTRDSAAQAAAAPAEARQMEVVLEALPGAPAVLLQQLTREEHAALPITEDSDVLDDESHLISAAVVDPKLSAEEWRPILAGWPIGAVIQLTSAIGEHNGLNAGAVRRAAQTFRP